MAEPRVLVVDDDPDIQDYFGMLLEDNGYEVASAENADMALTTIEEFEPDIVLVDVMMPGRSGLDLLVTLRNSPRWSSTPIVMITGNDKVLHDEFHSYLASHGYVRCPEAVLAKPIDREAMLTTLGKLIPATETP